jgi:iron complex transport system ATP-binding protein
MVPVQLEGVSAAYPGPSGKPSSAPNSLDDVSLELRAGELCVLLGPNGAGKSTLVRVIAGVLPATAGEIRIFGVQPQAMTRNELAQNIAVVPQRSDVALGFSVREVVAMGRAPHQGAMLRASGRDREAVEENLSTCDLRALAERPIAGLSGGEQKRVHIARALTQEAPILLLDEAGAHLDLRHLSELYRLVRSEVSERKLACLAVMHDLNGAAHIADRIVLMKDARVVADGTVAEVMTAKQLADTFEVQVHVGEHEGRRHFLVG